MERNSVLCILLEETGTIYFHQDKHKEVNPAFICISQEGTFPVPRPMCWERYNLQGFVVWPNYLRGSNDIH